MRGPLTPNVPIYILGTVNDLSTCSLTETFISHEKKSYAQVTVVRLFIYIYYYSKHSIVMQTLFSYNVSWFFLHTDEPHFSI